MGATFRGRGGLHLSVWKTIDIVALVLLAVLAIAGVASGHWMMVAFLVIGTASASWALHRGGRRPPPGGAFRDGHLSVEEGCLALDGVAICQRTELEQGLVLPHRGTTLVRLHRRGSRVPLWLRVANVDAAEQLLRAVGLDPAQVAAEVRIASRLGAMPRVQAVAWIIVPMAATVPMIYVCGVLLGHAAGPYAFALIFLLLTYLVALAIAPSTIRVGTDGVVVRWLGRDRFIAYSAMRDVGVYREQAWEMQQWHQQGVEITLAGGETLRLPTGRPVGPDVAAALVLRIQQARAARGAEAAPHPVAALARGGRAPHEWVTALRQVGSGASAGARTAAVPLDALIGLIEDGSAAAIDRVSAAVAALPYADPETKQRIRVAAENSASPKLRVALDRIERDPADEAAIAETLLELEEAPAPAVSGWTPGRTISKQ